MKYELGGESYNSKAQVRDRLRATLDRYHRSPHQAIGSKSHALLSDLLGRELGEVRVMSPRQAQQGGGRQATFYELLNMDVEQTIYTEGGGCHKVVSPYRRLSTSEAIAALGETTREYNKNRAYRNRVQVARHVIQAQVEQYRTVNNVGAGLDIDHIIPFQELLDSWAHSVGFDLGRMQWNDWLRESWGEYHQEHATLQALPASVNRSKGGTTRAEYSYTTEHLPLPAKVSLDDY